MRKTICPECGEVFFRWSTEKFNCDVCRTLIDPKRMQEVEG